MLSPSSLKATVKTSLQPSMSAPIYINLMGLSAGNASVVTRQTKLGGIVAVYHFRSSWGGFLARWLANKISRVRGLQLGGLWCTLGPLLHTSAQNGEWPICARVITGINVPHFNCIAPTWSSEVSKDTPSGKILWTHIPDQLDRHHYCVLVPIWLNLYRTSTSANDTIPLIQST